MLRQIFMLAMLNFRRWRRSPQIWLAFGLGFVACFLLTDKTVQFAVTHETVLQILEPFIWTFGDAQSILLISLCLLLLFSDMPALGAELPFHLVRTTRRRWMAAQILYLILATLIFTAFILVSSCILCQQYAFTANQWSETAAILGYSGIGSRIAVPAFVKVLELTYPYPCTVHIFLLMLCYSLLLSALIFLGNLLRERLGTKGQKKNPEARIETAKRLLAGTAHQLSDIARASGFSSAGYFSRTFAAVTGLSPTAWRESSR